MHIRNHRITDWSPQDMAAWEAANNKAPAAICYARWPPITSPFDWSLWSVMALFMPASIYGFPAGDKLLLGAVATPVGSCLRIPFAVP